MSASGGVTGSSGAASGGQLEERVDFSAETSAKVPQAQQLAESGQLQEALALLLALEKKCRVHNDNPSLVKVCETALTLCHSHDNSATGEVLLSTLQTLSTRRSQKTAAVQALVQTALPWCVEVPYTPLPVTNEVEETKRNELVKALLDITIGKIFLERERAQLTRALATIKVGDLCCGMCSCIIRHWHGLGISTKLAEHV